LKLSLIELHPSAPIQADSAISATHLDAPGVFAVVLVRIVNLQYRRPNLTYSHDYRVSMYFGI